jgi:hypothetical protein
MPHFLLLETKIYAIVGVPDGSGEILAGQRPIQGSLSDGHLIR